MADKPQKSAPRGYAKVDDRDPRSRKGEVVARARLYAVQRHHEPLGEVSLRPGTTAGKWRILGELRGLPPGHYTVELRRAATCDALTKPSAAATSAASDTTALGTVQGLANQVVTLSLDDVALPPDAAKPATQPAFVLILRDGDKSPSGAPNGQGQIAACGVVGVEDPA